MKLLNWILGKPDIPIIDVTLYLSRRSFVKEHRKNDDLTDREYILFALLVYGRVLRILFEINRNALDECYTTFIEISDNFKEVIQSHHFKKVERAMDIISSSHGSVHAWRIRMSAMHIYVGGYNTKEVQKFAYTAFLYAWEHIGADNRYKLLEGFSELSHLEMRGHLSNEDAVRHPDTIIAKLFPK